MKNLMIIVVVFFLLQPSFAQRRYFTKTGNVSFNAGTALEDIDGLNKSATCVFDASSGDIQFAILMKGFEFKRSLMMEHFNENYLETDKFPKSIFKGKITNLDKINFLKDGIYPANVKGILEIHGVKKEVESNGQFKVLGETVITIGEFEIVLEDYAVTIPSLVKDKISKTARIKVNCSNSILK